MIEGIHYTREGWREGDEATLENRPHIMMMLEAFNAAEDKHKFNKDFVEFYDSVRVAYEAALSDTLKLERARRSAAEIAAAAEEFYRTRPAGSNRSFWD